MIRLQPPASGEHLAMPDRRRKSDEFWLWHALDGRRKYRIVCHILGSALASLSVEARNYFLNKPNLQKLFPKSTLSWETIWNYFLNKPNLQKLFLKSTQFAETIS